MDRRINTRVEWNGPVKYRTQEMTESKIGMLANISTSGAMLWLMEDLAIGSPIEVVMQSEYDPKPVHMHMHVKRIEKSKREGYSGYGCSLDPV